MKEQISGITTYIRFEISTRVFKLNFEAESCNVSGRIQSLRRTFILSLTSKKEF